MKNKFMIAAVTAVTLGTMIFAYAQTPADELVEKNILEGYEDGQLHLERTLTRAEFTKIFTDAFLNDASDDTDTIDTDIFSDVPDNHWAKYYIARAYDAGVIRGFDDGTFHPEETVTYEQAMKMIMQYCKNRNMVYPQGYIAAALESGITDGVKAVIGEEITRGDVVNIITNAMQYMEDNKEPDYEYSYYTLSYAAPGSKGSGGASNASGSGGAIDAMMNTASAPMIAESALYSYSDSDSGYYAPVSYEYPVFNTEEYDANDENVFKNALISPLSTFSIDTDTASYSNMRRYILSNALPPNGSIRTEELINYFDYDNPAPTDGRPFAIATEVAECPWNSGNNLAMISIQGEEMTERKPSNLVFLVDVSGSMYTSDKLPLVKKSLKLLLDELDENDTISIVTYASGTGVALESTPVSEKDKIIEALDRLQAGGGTSGAAGINLAYEQAQSNLIDGNNRIILCTDGDFNIGASSTGDLEKLITEKRDKGIFLTVLGFGMGNYKDNRMETLADKGNGNYAYIDSEREAKKVFVDEMPKTLYTIAKDVKIQVEFNPVAVKEYRLVGYENRVLNNEDFDNDKKDAGELGSGAAVTAFYEIVPADGSETAELKYQTAQLNDSDELMTVKVRYKEPDGDESELIEQSVDNNLTENPSGNFTFAAALAELGMILNDSEYKGSADMNSVLSLAREGIGEDSFGFRTEFLHLADLLRYMMDYGEMDY
ncbi:MAG: von Willebrand factor type A domain-containing protein [Oscillospiraceae bacterium]|nr:von Willebrand factor type A domain-containing protein [Oscillospiraceae bacterium]